MSERRIITEADIPYTFRRDGYKNVRIRDYQKRTRVEESESDSEWGSGEESEEEDQTEQIQQLQTEMAVLRTTIRLLCEKFGEPVPESCV
jgi:hypothetical protein